MTALSHYTCSFTAFISMHHFPFPSISSTSEPISRWTTSPFCVGTCESLLSPSTRTAHQMAKVQIHHRLWGVSRPSPILAYRTAPQGVSVPAPRARDRGHVSCCTSSVQQLQMLLICRLMYFGGELCQRTGEWSKPAVQLEWNRLGGFLHCKSQSERQPQCPEWC